MLRMHETNQSMNESINAGTRRPAHGRQPVQGSLTSTYTASALAVRPLLPLRIPCASCVMECNDGMRRDVMGWGAMQHNYAAHQCRQLQFGPDGWARNP